MLFWESSVHTNMAIAFYVICIQIDKLHFSDDRSERFAIHMGIKRKTWKELKPANQLLLACNKKWTKPVLLVQQPKIHFDIAISEL